MYAQLKDNVFKEQESNLLKKKSADKMEDQNMKKEKKLSRKSSSRNELRESLIRDDYNHNLTSTLNINLSRKKTGTKIGANIIQNSTDPYYVFREDLVVKLQHMEDELVRFTRVIENVEPMKNQDELKGYMNKIKCYMKKSESTLKDLESTVHLVGNNRENFPHIDDSDFYDRKSFVSISSERIKEVKNGINLKLIKNKKGLGDKHSSINQANKTEEIKSNEILNTKCFQKYQLSPEILMKKQDETLDVLDNVVSHVGNMAGAIHEDLEMQNKMLEKLEDDFDIAEEQLGIVMGKLAKMFQTKNKYQIGIILFMVLIVLILLFLVMYT